MDPAELARAAGVTLERVELMTSLGLLRPDADGRHRPSEIQLVRILEALDASGIELATLGEMVERGEFSTMWAERMFAEPVRMSGTTLRRLCEEVGITVDVARRTFIASRLAAPEPDDELREDDAQLLRLSALGLHAMQAGGADQRDVLTLFGPIGELLRRVAETQMRTFRETFEAPLFAQGGSVVDAFETIGQAAAVAHPVAIEVVRTIHARHLESVELEETVRNTELALARAGRERRLDAHPPAIAFLDLSDSTRFTEAEGDEEAARLASRLAAVIEEVAAPCGGRLVKLLGDGAMVHFPDPSAAAEVALGVVEQAQREGLPPARVGLHAGQVVARAGDLFGRTVIVAARMNDYARPREVLVSDTVAALTANDAVRFDEIGPVSLKGLTEPVTLLQARRA